jgi:hypothetical protein
MNNLERRTAETLPVFSVGGASGGAARGIAMEIWRIAARAPRHGTGRGVFCGGPVGGPGRRTPRPRRCVTHGCEAQITHPATHGPSADHLPATPATIPTKSTGPVRAVRPFPYCYSTRKILNYLFWGEMRGRIAIGNTPDRSDRPDRGVGKVDLLGVVAGILSVVELKCASGSDAPLRALVEGLAYWPPSRPTWRPCGQNTHPTPSSTRHHHSRFSLHHRPTGGAGTTGLRAALPSHA